jgi:hypothetical protein
LIPLERQEIEPVRDRKEDPILTLDPNGLGSIYGRTLVVLDLVPQISIGKAFFNDAERLLRFGFLSNYLALRRALFMLSGWPA